MDMIFVRSDFQKLNLIAGQCLNTLLSAPGPRFRRSRLFDPLPDIQNDRSRSIHYDSFGLRDSCPHLITPLSGGVVDPRRNEIHWTIVALTAAAFLLLASLFGGRGYGGWGMMAPGMMGGWGFSPFGWVGMIFMWLIPLGFIVLAALGVVWLVRAAGSGNQSTLPGQSCPSCGQTVQADWRNCPHCDTQLLK